MPSYNLPSRQLVSQGENSLVERAHVPRSQFRNRYGLKTAFDAGMLYPILLEECLPGDHVRYQIRGYIRTAEPVFPLLDSQRIDIHAFYCPNRILWENWPKMLGAQTNPGDSTAYTVPIISSGLPANGIAVGHLMDYLGVPTVGQIQAGQGANLILNALPPRMYNRVWNAWYRDQNLQNSAVESTADTGGSLANFNLLPRNKSHDFFTSALTAPQKGVAPTIGLTGIAPVFGIASDTTAAVGPFAVTDTNGIAQSYGLAYRSAVESIIAQVGISPSAPGVYADLTQGSANFSINTFRLAMGMQTVLERDARGGTRYIEQMKMHWGIDIPDYRLQRPEFLGGGSMSVHFTPVANTNADGSDALGTLGAAGTADGTINVDYAALEHGYIMILASVKTELSYQQGLARLWTRRTRWDFPIPGLMELGEQAVLMQEIYCTGNPTNDLAVFGYQARNEEYRTEVSRVTGLMRSTATGNIDEWHFAQQFTAAPTLGDTFIRDTPPMTRVLAAGSAANGIQYKADFVYDRVITRPVPLFGTPSSLARF